MKECANYAGASASDCMYCDEKKTCRYRKDIQANIVAFSVLMMLAVIIGGIVGYLIGKLIF